MNRLLIILALTLLAMAGCGPQGLTGEDLQGCYQVETEYWKKKTDWFKQNWERFEIPKKVKLSDYSKVLKDESRQPEIHLEEGWYFKKPDKVGVLIRLGKFSELIFWLYKTDLGLDGTLEAYAEDIHSSDFQAQTPVILRPTSCEDNSLIVSVSPGVNVPSAEEVSGCFELEGMSVKHRKPEHPMYESELRKAQSALPRKLYLTNELSTSHYPKWPRFKVKVIDKFDSEPRLQRNGRWMSLFGGIEIEIYYESEGSVVMDLANKNGHFHGSAYFWRDDLQPLIVALRRVECE